MNYSKTHIFLLTLILLFSCSYLSAAMLPGEETESKALDLSKHHNVGNTWLRISNYGFFGSGNATQRWPSLEYPGGSGIDYLYQGALWFGAQKVRRNAAGDEFYWTEWPTDDMNGMITQYIRDQDGVIIGDHPDWTGNQRIVIDTLVTIGFDGYWSVYELLPAWNTLEAQRTGYQEFNRQDVVIEASTRVNRRGFDNDGDGLIDEDPVGRTFPFRQLRTEVDGIFVDLPRPFWGFEGRFIHEVTNANMGIDGPQVIRDNFGIWYPLGFMDLSFTNESYPIVERFNIATPYNDDHDLLTDEDGAPISEQDFISYYYDYSPFNGPAIAPIRRVLGSSNSRNTHMPLNIRVRQMSFQWSYDFIQNLTYVEFNITNMNPRDTLYNCVMGIYMDCDTGPQSWDDQRRSTADVSGYVAGENMEFAYTRNYLFPTITPHWIGARVVNPDPEQLVYSAWVYALSPGPGPEDSDPLNYFNQGGGRRTANEKYWLLSGRNPDERRFVNMRERAVELPTNSWEQPGAVDTRFLFAFYGDMQGYDEPTEESWNLKPFDTMKIVVALFPGENLEDLKESAAWAKTIYGDAQTLTTVILPDTFPHYEPPEPPDFPFMYSELVEEPLGSGNINLDLYWGNRSEFSLDYTIVDRRQYGWQEHTVYLDSYVGNWDPTTMPAQFDPNLPENENLWNGNATINPYTGWRLRHSFQGYTIWSRAGRGDRDGWMSQYTWDKIDTATDHYDYENTNAGTLYFLDMGGDLGRETGLPNPTEITDADIAPGGLFYGVDDAGKGYVYTTLQEDYFPRDIREGDIVYGKPIYNMRTAQEAQALAKHDPRVLGRPLNQIEREENQLLFKHADLRDEIFLTLVEDTMIPLAGHLGFSNVNYVQNNSRSQRGISEDGEESLLSRQYRLSRRYYQAKISNLPKGREFYASVTAWSRGIPHKKLGPLESGRDANMDVYFAGPLAQSNMKNVYVVPNPYRGGGTLDGNVTDDPLGDRSRRIWFVNLPARANVQIFTLAGDLVDEFEHYPGKSFDVLSISREVLEAVGPGGMHPWNLLSRHNQIIASGLYFYSVKCHDSGDVQVGRFAVIR
ncbi:MAG: hypothetical protein FWG98_11225 [Candidatus Cloacimonetes bacterium]|nr:hypothetical protein [Candidatus Cloacimonadota bacterium]